MAYRNQAALSALLAITAALLLVFWLMSDSSDETPAQPVSHLWERVAPLP